jgi:hypothetical protein
LFFDNACGLRSHLEACGHMEILKNVAFVVDSFHFRTHRESDVYCRTFCDPNQYPVLRGAGGKWLFNTSVAEQTNAWFGKFQANVKEMNVIRYNFYLDEVIEVHNRLLTETLERRGLHPSIQSFGEKST